MTLDPALREAARDEKRVWTSGSIAAAVAAAVGAAMASPVAVPFGVIAVLGRALAYRSELIAEDPPDSQFRSSVRPKSRPLRPSVFPDLEEPMRPLVNAAIAMNDAVFFLDPTIRAYERAQGAARHGDLDALGDRLDEARRYAHAAAGHLHLLPEAAPAVRRFGETAGRNVSVTVAFAEPPADLMVSLYESRLSPDDITDAVKLWRDGAEEQSTYDVLRDPWTTLATAMEDMRFADALGRWLLDPVEAAHDLW
jgi:hypothetical protein